MAGDSFGTEGLAHLFNDLSGARGRLQELLDRDEIIPVDDRYFILAKNMAKGIVAMCNKRVPNYETDVEAAAEPETTPAVPPEIHTLGVTDISE